MLKRVFLFVLILSASLLLSGAKRSADVSKLIADSFAAWNAGDAEKVASFYTDDVVYDDIPFNMSAKGHAEMVKFAGDFMKAVPDLKLELISASVEGDHGSCEWRLTGTDVGLFKTGKKFDVRGASRFELRGNKFAKNKDFYDAATIMRQIGALPAETK